MNAILVVAVNTFRQTVRQRLFYNVLIFGFGMLLLSMAVGQITFGHPARVVRSIGLAGVSIALDLVALLIGVSLIHQEIDRKTLFVVLTRPIRRWQYVLGRYLGLLATLVVALAGFSLTMVLALLLSHGTPQINDAIVLLVALPEAAMLAAVGLTLSAFSTPTVGAGMGLGVWIAGTTADDLVRLSRKADATTQALARALNYVLPSFERFNFREAAIYDTPVEVAHLVGALGYGVTYCAFLVGLASVILSRRQML